MHAALSVRDLLHEQFRTTLGRSTTETEDKETYNWP
jgi:hypothetical protein